MGSSPNPKNHFPSCDDVFKQSFCKYKMECKYRLFDSNYTIHIYFFRMENRILRFRKTHNNEVVKRQVEYKILIIITLYLIIIFWRLITKKEMGRISLANDFI